MTPKVYCDMDGVVADFDRGWEEFTNTKISGWVTITDADWARLKKQWPTFWMDLEPMPFAEELWDALRPYTPDILTAVPDAWKSAGIGKTTWAREVLGGVGKVHAVRREDKRNFAKQRDGTPNILIDDMEKNIKEWNAAGGLGIRYIPSASMVQRVIRFIESHLERHGA